MDSIVAPDQITLQNLADPAVDGSKQNGTEESTDELIERLGRERPPRFKNLAAELGFCLSMMLSEYFVSGFIVVLPVLAQDLAIPDSESTWPASAFTLVAGAFLLPFGRLGDMYGGYVLYLAGLAWHFVWSLVAGFSRNYLMLDLCRALQGLGPAAFLPASVMLMGSAYRPGPRKNLVFSIYGACAPVGFFLGILFGGLAAQTLTWRWYFWLGAILTFLAAVMAFLAVPSDMHEKRENKLGMDWMGSIAIVSALLLIVFALTQCSRAPQGWRTPYILITVLLGAVCLVAAVYIEGWIAKDPLLPATLFRVSRMKALTTAIFLSYGAWGTWLFYTCFFVENIVHASPLITVAYYTPSGIGGLILPAVAGLFLHRIPGTFLLWISATAYVLAPLLLALAPPDASYWTFIFPSMICATLGIDITYPVTNIWITTNLSKSQQGLAGALINSLLFLGNSFCLGLADIVAASTSEHGMLESYRASLWFAVACAGLSLLLMVAFVRVDIAKSDLTTDERRELEVKQR